MRIGNIHLQSHCFSQIHDGFVELAGDAQRFPQFVSRGRHFRSQPYRFAQVLLCGGPSALLRQRQGQVAMRLGRARLKAQCFFEMRDGLVKFSLPGQRDGTVVPQPRVARAAADVFSKGRFGLRQLAGFEVRDAIISPP
jgi:hypothetical protein